MQICVLKMDEDIDVDLLITLVRERPVLWDKTLEKYKDRSQTFQAWKEIFIELNENYEDLEDREKNEYRKHIMKKWRNIRDSFRKSRAKNKEAKKWGVKSFKTYIYESQLQFLEGILQSRDGDELLSQDFDYDYSLEFPDENDGLTTQSEDQVEPPSSKNVTNQLQPSKKKLKVDLAEIKTLNDLREKPNRHEFFFNSVLPSLEDFNELDVLEFQMDVLKSISKIKQRKLHATVGGGSAPLNLTHCQHVMGSVPQSTSTSLQHFPISGPQAS